MAVGVHGSLSGLHCSVLQRPGGAVPTASWSAVDIVSLKGCPCSLPSTTGAFWHPSAASRPRPCTSEGAVPALLTCFALCGFSDPARAREQEGLSGVAEGTGHLGQPSTAASGVTGVCLSLETFPCVVVR